MVPEALARANAAVGNELGAAGIEVFGAFTVAARGGRLTVADDAGNARQLSDGETFAVAAGEEVRVRYLAVRGGVAVRPVLGARGTMLGPRLGGLDGRPLRRDDQLEVGAAARAGSAPLPGPAAPQPAVEVTLGPDDAPEVAAAMLAATFTVDAASDRVGTRLLGPRLPAHPMQSAHDRASAPMVLGAIELTPSGLVVLGPDHPTTGGYPVIAVVRASSLGDMFSRAVGARVRFVS
jgi:allophanate hydrolase subunit 2